MNFHRCGYTFATHHIKEWKSPNVGAGCDVIVLARPGFSRERIAAALKKLSAAVEKLPEPNGTAYVPTARYEVTDKEEVTQQPKSSRHVAPTIG